MQPTGGFTRQYSVRTVENEMSDRRFADFYVFDYPKLVSAIRLITGDADAARDAVDEACARAWNVSIAARASTSSVRGSAWSL